MALRDSRSKRHRSKTPGLKKTKVQSNPKDEQQNKATVLRTCTLIYEIGQEMGLVLWMIICMIICYVCINIKIWATKLYISNLTWINNRLPQVVSGMLMCYIAFQMMCVFGMAWNRQYHDLRLQLVKAVPSCGCLAAVMYMTGGRMYATSFLEVLVGAFLYLVLCVLMSGFTYHWGQQNYLGKNFLDEVRAAFETYRCEQKKRRH